LADREIRCGPSRRFSALTCTVSHVPPKKSWIGTNWMLWTVWTDSMRGEAPV
jgi:hypothetical protein